ncbi:MAG: tetratricopeptide repeat protein [bacterium]|nr:tetratricopeptide repeat protein [bacterium]
MADAKHIKLDKKTLKKNELAIFVDHAIRYTRTHPKQVIIPVVATVVGILLIYASISYFKEQQKSAELSLLEGIQFYHNAFQSQDRATQTINYTQCIEKFKSVSEKYSRTKSGQYARLYLADVYFRLNRTDDAINTYQEILKKSPRGFIAAWAQLSLGYIYLNRHDFPKAIAAFDQLVNHQPDSFLISEALVQLGKSYEQTGNLMKAKECYNRVIKTYPNSGWAAEASSRLGVLANLKPNG